MFGRQNGHSLYLQKWTDGTWIFFSPDVLFRQHTSPLSWLQECADPKAVARAHLLYDPEQSLKVVGGKWIERKGWWKGGQDFERFSGFRPLVALRELIFWCLCIFYSCRIFVNPHKLNQRVCFCWFLLMVLYIISEFQIRNKTNQQHFLPGN